MARQYLYRSITVALLILIVVGVYAPAVTPVEAQRAVTVVGDRSGAARTSALKNTLTAAATGISANADAALAYKEYTLDPIAYALARKVIQQMVASTVAWINSGFQGSPAFVTDLGGFLTDVADDVAGDFIYGSELGFLCSPFELDVRIALETTYQQQSAGYEPQCTLTDVVGNVENFLQGSFSEGGWQGWFELTQGETNDPNAAYLDAQLELYAAIRNAQGEEITLLDWGDGFLSYKVCSDTQVQSGAQTNCDIVTPGRVIADQLNASLGVGRDMLITADEVNEIIGALIAQLAQQALTGINGLLGLGGSSRFSDNRFGADGSSSYLDALAAEDPAATSSPGGTRNIQNTALEDAIAAENQRLDLAFEVVTRIEAAEADYNDRAARLDTYAEAACEAPTYPSEFDNWYADYLSTITRSNQSLTALNELKRRFDTTTDPDEQSQIATAFLGLQQTGQLATQVTNTQLELFIEFELREEINDLEDDLDDAERDCERARNDDDD